MTTTTVTYPWCSVGDDNLTLLPYHERVGAHWTVRDRYISIVPLLMIIYHNYYSNYYGRARLARDPTTVIAGRGTLGTARVTRNGSLT
jgi:hypothetical protein